MTGFDPDRDAIARVPRIAMFAINAFGALLVIAALFLALYALDLSLLRSD